MQFMVSDEGPGGGESRFGGCGGRSSSCRHGHDDDDDSPCHLHSQMFWPFDRATLQIELSRARSL